MNIIECKIFYTYYFKLDVALEIVLTVQLFVTDGCWRRHIVQYNFLNIFLCCDDTMTYMNKSFIALKYDNMLDSSLINQNTCLCFPSQVYLSSIAANITMNRKGRTLSKNKVVMHMIVEVIFNC